MKVNFILGLFAIVTFATCKKPDLPKPVEPSECWEKFIGNYTVYDTSAGISFPLTITHVIDTNFSGNEADFLIFENFDNNFDFSSQFTCMSPSNQLNIGFNVNLTDKFGHHYNVWHVYDDTTTSELENILNRDTLNLYFRVENTAYWLSDGTPFVDVYKHQIAVKQF